MSDCPFSLEPLPAEALAEQITGGERYPLSGGIDLTAHCNLGCVHCYMRPYRDEPELTTDEWKRVFGELADAGTLSLQISGGEPMTRPDFLELYRTAREHGFVVSLFTNATLVTEAIAREVGARPPVWVEVSLYGASEETTQAVCRRAGVFAQAVTGVKRLKEAGLQVILKTMLLRDNAWDLEKLQALAEQLDCPFRFNGEIFGRIGGEPIPDEVLVPDDQCAAIEWTDEAHQTYWSGVLDQPVPPRSSFYHCRAGQNGYYIGPYGDMNVCILMREPGYSLKTGTFREGWEVALPAALRRPFQPRKCDTCELLSLCMPCPAKNALEHGDPERLSERLCRRSHAIARTGPARWPAEDV